jgi:hypothetical protein
MNNIPSRITGAIKATYNFFVGDAIILVAVVTAFIVVGILVHRLHVANPIAAITLIVIIVAGLATTLGRELAGRKR